MLDSYKLNETMYLNISEYEKRIFEYLNPDSFQARLNEIKKNVI